MTENKSMPGRLSKYIYPAAFIIAVILSLIHVFFCYDVYDDIAYAYLPMVRNFVAGNWSAAFSGLPVLVPTLAGIIAASGVHEFTAMVIVSCIFYIATILLVYRFVKYFFPAGNYAAWGALLYVTAPKIIRFSCSGLLNSSRNFFLLWAVYLIFSYRGEKKFSKLVYLGVSLAGLSLGRGEGIVAVPFIIAGLLLLLLHEKKFVLNRQLWRRLALAFLVPAAVFTVVILPRLVQSYNDFGVPFIDARQAPYIEKVTSFRLNAPLEAINTPKPFPICDYEHFIPEDKRGAALFSLRRLGEFLSCFTRGAYELYLVFAGIGLFFWIYRRRGFGLEYSIIAMIVLLFCLIYFCLSNSYRYFTFILIFLLPLTLYGIEKSFDIISRYVCYKYVKHILCRYVRYKYARHIAGDYIHRKLLKHVLFLAGAVIIIAQLSNGLTKVVKNKYGYERDGALWLKKYVEKTGIPVKLGLKKHVLFTEVAPFGFWSGFYFKPFVLPREGESAKTVKNYLLRNVDFIVLEAGDKKFNDFVIATGIFRKIASPYDKKLSIYLSSASVEKLRRQKR